MQLLLLSNSTSDNGFLVDWLDLMRAFVGDDEALFVPYAGVIASWDAYETRVADALASAGVRIRSIHRAGDPLAALAVARCLVVGGGNTFNLLHHMRRNGLLASVAQRVRSGSLRYLGWSAGANLACPTIRTTNDMPVIDPGGFEALGLVPFQINPHFVDGRPPGHHGETRSERIAEFTRLNPSIPVLGLPEGCYVRVDDATMTYGGRRDGVWLRHGAKASPVVPGALAVP